MAFEYLMAHYMLTGQLRLLVDRAELLPELGYEIIPRHYAEALAIAKQLGIGSGLPPGGLAVEAGTQEQIMLFTGLSTKHGRNVAALSKEIAKKMRGSYFRYFYVILQAGRTP